MMQKSVLPRAVILTALPLEFEAAVTHLRNRREDTHPQGTVYEVGLFKGEDRTWEVLVAEVGAGNEITAAACERAIQHFRPCVAMFVGVAGGLKDVQLGDVVASTKIYNYEYGKAKEIFEPRPNVNLSSHRLEQRAKAVARSDTWPRRVISDCTSPRPPKAFVQPIAAGSAVVAAKRAALYQFIRKQYGDAVAVEMEGHGHLLAVHLNAPVEGIVVRGISDLVQGKSSEDDVHWQPVAARHAAAFAFEILARLDTGMADASARDLAGSSVTRNLSARLDDPNDAAIDSDAPAVVDSTIIRSKIREDEQQRITMALRTSGIAGAGWGNAPSAATTASVRSLIAREAERLRDALISDLINLNYAAVTDAAKRAKSWLSKHESDLPQELAADLYVALAEVLTALARLELKPGQLPDLSEAEHYLQRGRTALEQ
jgi:nucleoside phosphorylase